MITNTTDNQADRISLLEAIEQRHSVRQYEDKPLPASIVAELADAIYECNQVAGLHIQLITNEPEAFAGGLARYGKFAGVSNYIAMVGKKAGDLEERCGYYGERLVLLAQQMGLNTCWVGMTFMKRKTAYVLDAGEKLVILIALGYGKTPGTTRKSKSFGDVNRSKGEIPTWYRRGVEAALLAPTATNQQKFAFSFHPVSKRGVGGSAEFGAEADVAGGAGGAANAADGVADAAGAANGAANAAGATADAAGAASAADAAGGAAAEASAEMTAAEAELAAIGKTAGEDMTGAATEALPGVHAEVDGFGFFSKVDLGIVRYHFEVGAEDAGFRWV